MQCSNCSGHNFTWARRCDHCGHPFQPAAPQERTAGAPSDRAEAVVLDLGRHAPDEAAGKTITINGVEYGILERSRTIRSAHVYPLRNLRTRLIMFELKVFLCEPGSPAFESIRQRGRRIFAEK